MKLIELFELLQDDRKIEKYLIEIGILKYFDYCEKCGSDKIGRIRRGKNKCYSCNNEWNRRKGSILEGINLGYEKILLFMKLLEYKFRNQKIQDELNMNRITVKKLKNQLKKLSG